MFRVEILQTQYLHFMMGIEAIGSMSTQETFIKLPLFAWPSVKHVGIGSTCDIVPPYVLLEETPDLNVPVVKTKDFFSVKKKDKTLRDI